MSTLDERRTVASAGVRDYPAADGLATRIFLQPIAAPSILGLAGFAGATFIVASNLAGWWGTPKSPLALAPFAAMFGGVAQFMAGMWSYRARDAIATLAHGTWGSFWIAYLILNILVGTHVVTQPAPWFHNPEVGFWFFALAITTAIAAFAALAESAALVAVLGTLAAGSGITAGAFIYGSLGWAKAGGWVFVISACLAWYVVLAMVTAFAFGRTIFPLFKYQRAANVPRRKTTVPIELEWAEPGVKMGQ
jgi:succinate-acetate transporter protein